MTRLQVPIALEQEIAALHDLARPELAARWCTHYKTDPPKGISRTLLIRAAAYAIQVKATRGLKPAVRRRLHSDAKLAMDGTSPTRRPALQPGARLIREWNGKTYSVEVVENGFIWNGEQHRSLSAVARAITSARWSGPRFFGVGSGDAQ
jgi:Protein of unknown function (DUF2924)